MRIHRNKKRIAALALVFTVIFTSLNATLFVTDSGAANAASVDVRPVGDSIEGSTTIEEFKYSISSGADVSGNTGTWHATSGNAGHAFLFTIDYSVSGIKNSQPGDIEIRIPLNLFKNKDGEWADSLDLSVPPDTPENMAESPEYVYDIEEIDGQRYVVIKNVSMKTNESSSAKTGFFELGFVLEDATYEYEDMLTSVPFTAEIWTRDPATGELVHRTDGGQKIQEDPLYLVIDTSVEIASTKKEVYNNKVYESWNSAWGTEPADSEDYVYLVWEIKTEIDKHLSQKYDFWIEDIPESPDMEVVAYNMYGCGTGWHSEEEMKVNPGLYGLTYTGVRYDYVLTRHKRDTYDNQLTEDYSSYTVKNTETAIVHPVDEVDPDTNATASGTYTREKHPFTPPVGTVSPHKKGLTTTFELNDFKNGYNIKNQSVDKISGLKYDIKSDYYGYEWTYEDGADVNDPESYGKQNVHYVLFDDKLELNGQKLSDDDYGFESLSLSYTVHSAEFYSTDNMFEPVNPVFTDTNKMLYLEVRRAGETEFKRIAEFDMQTGRFSDFDNSEVTVNSTAKSVEFKHDDVVAYRLAADNNFYNMKLENIASVTLKRNEHTLEIVGDSESALLNNTVTMEAYRNGEEVMSRSATGRDNVYPESRESIINKEVTTSRNHALEQYFTITWHAWMRENLKIATVEPISQSSGTFYDLLPDGNEVDLDSIFVEVEQGRILDKSDYTVSVQPNYKNSNRTLLTIHIKEPALYYDVYFDTVYTWDSIHDFGKVIYNPIAYETGNESIANGKPDNGGVGKVKYTNNKFFTGLDPDTTEDNRRFIYNETEYDAYVVTSASSGLDKKIRDTEGSTYSYATVSAPGETYMYQLRFANGNITKADNIILFDNIEEYTPVIDGREMPRDWYGSLIGVDVSQAVKNGALPKVYFNTEGGLDFTQSEYNDVTNSAVWTEIPIDYNLTDTADEQIAAYLSAHPDLQVKSVAIDFSESADGTPYTLDKGKTVFAILYMKAPEKTEQGLSEWTSATHGTDFPMTYNDVYLKAEVINEHDEKETYVYEQAYTSASYHITGNIKLHKYNIEYPSESIHGISFRLFGTSSYGTAIDETYMTDSSGELTFSGIELGTYTLQEVSDETTNPDWMTDHTPHEVTVGLNEIIIDGEDFSEHPFEVGNMPRAHADVEFIKHKYGNNMEFVEGAVFRLSGLSDYGNDILMVKTTDEYGKIQFDNVEAGTYTMREVEAPDDYFVSKTDYTVIVDENGNYSISAPKDDDSLEHDLSGKFYISDERKHELLFYKTASVKDEEGHVSGIGLNGAVFSLTGYTLDGEAVSMTAASNNAFGTGSVLFSGLSAGHYVLTETAVPQGSDYILDAANRVVTITRDGMITIDGRVLDYDTQYEVYNPSRAQQIVVIKVWEDGLTDVEREKLNLTPLIKVSTEDPTVVYGSTAIFGSSYNNIYQGNKPFSKTVQDTMKCFKRASVSTDELKQKPGAVIISDPSSDYEIWGWYDDDDDTFYWQSDARKAQFNSKNTRVFCDCLKLEEVNLTGVDTSTLTSFERMFFNCASLKTVIGNLDCTSATSCNCMFMVDANHPQLYSPNTTQLTFSNTQNITDFGSMFQNWKKVTSIPLVGLDTSGGKNFNKMFYDCERATYINAGTINTSNAVNLSEMFGYCYWLQELDVSRFSTSRVTNMSYMFKNCTSLTSLNLLSFDTSNVTTMQQMFYGDYNLHELDLSSFDISKVTNIADMFNLNPGNYNSTFPSQKVSGSSPLTTIYVSEKFVLDSVTTGDTETVFDYCNNLVGGNGTAYKNEPNGPKYRKQYAYIDGKDGHKGYFTEKAFSNPSAANVNSRNASRRLAGIPARAPQGGTMTEISSDETEYCTIVKAGDTWTYTFTVGEYEKAYVWEDFVPEGYTADVTIDTPAVVVDGKATIKNKKTVDAPTYGSLSISKQVINQNGSTLTAWPSSYQFKIILTDANHQQLKGLLNCGGTIFNDGEYILHLSSTNTSYTIPNIPTGYHYTITETNGDSHTTVASDGGAAVKSVIASGTIAADTLSTAAFTNTVYEDNRDVEDVRVAKLVTGGETPDTDFHFVADFTNLKVNAEYRIEEDNDTHALITSFTSDEHGNGFVQFTLKQGETAVIKDLPYTDGALFESATYLIRELRTEDYIPSYTVTDANGGHNINRTSDSAPLNTALSTARESADPNESVTVTYSNAIVQKRDLILKKKLDSPFSDNRKFSFTVNFTGLGQDTAYYISKVGRVVSNSDGTASFDINLASGDTVLFRDLPVGCSYTITENAVDANDEGQKYIASYQITSTGGGTIEKASDQAQGYGKALSTQTEYLDPNEDATVTFTNVLPTLTVSKKVAGNMGNRIKSFGFTALFTNAGSPLSGYKLRCIDADGNETSVTTDADGKAEFTLKHDESYVIAGLPLGASFEIVESEEDSRGYLTTVTDNSEGPLDGKGIITLSPSTVDFTNTRNVLITTGVNITVVLSVILAFSLCFAIAVFIRKRYFCKGV